MTLQAYIELVLNARPKGTESITFEVHLNSIGLVDDTAPNTITFTVQEQ